MKEAYEQWRKGTVLDKLAAMSQNGEVSVDTLYKNENSLHSIVNNIYFISATAAWEKRHGAAVPFNSDQRRHAADVTKRIVRSLRKRSIRW